MYNSVITNQYSFHSLLSNYKPRQSSKVNNNASSKHCRVWPRVFTNSMYGGSFKQKVTEKCQSNRKNERSSLVETVNKQQAEPRVMLSNAFAILGELGEQEIDQLLHRPGILTPKGQLFSEENKNSCIITNESTKLGHGDKCQISNGTVVDKEGQSSTKYQGEACCVKKIDQNNVILETNREEKSQVTHTRVNLKKSVEITRAVLNGNNACMRHVNVLDIADKCVDLKRCIEQQKNMFGFVPITNLKRMKMCHSLIPNKVLDSETFDPVRTYHAVRNIGGYNFEKAKIQPPSDINFALLEDICRNYWDYQLPYFLKYGFPLDFPRDKELCSTETSHASAVNYPSHVDTYLRTELDHKAIFGPYQDKPYGFHTHVSPFMSREKNDSDNRHIIIDLSWPENASINHFTLPNDYLGTVYQIRYPTIDDITDKILRLGDTVYLYKIDLSRAFRQLRIDPGDFNLLTLCWLDSYYADTFCPFGHRSGAMACTRVTDLFRYVMTQCGDVIFNYVDDLIGCGRRGTVEDAFQFLKQLLEKLDFPISQSKLVEPSHECHCLGVLINTKERTLSLTAEKIAEIIDKCSCMLNSEWASKRQLQSVIGSLMFLHKCVRPTRFFVNRLLHTLRVSNNRFKVTEDMRRDLRWFLRFAPQFNGTTTYDHVVIDQMETLHIDACLTGVGGVWKNNVYMCDIPDDMNQNNGYNITHFELINILVALKIWGHLWCHQKVLIYTDNMAVVSIYTTGFTRDDKLAAFVRNIWLYTSRYDIQLVVQHIPGKDNSIADMLSRWQSIPQAEVKLSEYITDPIWWPVKADTFQISLDI